MVGMSRDVPMRVAVIGAGIAGIAAGISLVFAVATLVARIPAIARVFAVRCPCSGPHNLLRREATQRRRNGRSRPTCTAMPSTRKK